MMNLHWFKHIQFAYPWLLPLYIVVAYLVYWYVKNNSASSIKITTTYFLQPQKTWKTALRHVPFILRCISLIFLITALAKPQIKNIEELVEGEGIDIVLCMDISGSMTEKDFLPNRLEASKSVAIDFVQQRKGDRVGVVIFTNQSFTLCPVTTDLTTVLSQIENIKSGYLEELGTAIGSGLATSVDRLRNSKSKTKIIILLTDGVDNGGLVPPDIAKEMAKQYAIKVYTIGVGSTQAMTENVATTKGSSTQKRNLEFNEDLLKQIATETGGEYFLATNKKALQQVYEHINQLEKTKIETTTFTKTTEKYFSFLLIGLLVIVAEIILRLTIFKKFP